MLFSLFELLAPIPLFSFPPQQGAKLHHLIMSQYRKISAADIFTGKSFTGPGMVVILDTKNRIQGIIPVAEAGDNIEFFDGIICPGFINTHCHIELSHMKGRISQQTGLVEFVQSVMKDRGEAEEIKQNAMVAAKDELYNSGTSAVGDICNTPDSIFLKKQGGLHWHNFIEISGFVEAGAEKRFEDARMLRQKFEKELPQFQTTLSPHSPYSVSKKLFGLINDATAGQTITIHNQETEAETELYQKGTGNFLSLYSNFGIDISSFAHTGKSSFESWLPYFDNGQKIICVHNTFMQENDLEFFRQKTKDERQKAAQVNNERISNNEQSTTNNVFFTLCPRANLYIENKLPPVELLMKNDMTIALGTDSYAGNTTLNILEEIKTIRKHFPGIGMGTILQWATANGAKALGIEDKFGHIKEGISPGLVLIDPAFQTSQRIV